MATEKDVDMSQKSNINNYHDTCFACFVRTCSCVDAYVTLFVGSREPTGVVTLFQDGDLVFAIGAILKGMPTVRQR